MKVNYSCTTPPQKYKCKKCGKHGCKLWREYQTCADYVGLLCCDCAGVKENINVSSIDEKGKYESKHGKTDQIGWYVPAIPTEEGDTYWGYTSVPKEGRDWWYNLPSR